MSLVDCESFLVVLEEWISIAAQEPLPISNKDVFIVKNFSRLLFYQCSCSFSYVFVRPMTSMLKNTTVVGMKIVKQSAMVRFGRQGVGIHVVVS